MNNPRTYRFLISAVCLGLAASLVSAQTNAQAQLKKGQALWNQRLSKSAIAALEVAAKDKSTAAAANEALGRIYTFKGWQQEGVFPGWHDEPTYREKALAALRAAVAAEHFIDENLSAYQMEGKIQAARVRNRAIAADDIGWARFMKKDFAGAAAKLEESHRLSQGADFVNLAHLGDLNVVLKQPDKAREYYLDALTVAGADPKIRQRIIRELPSVRGNAGAGKPFVT